MKNLLWILSCLVLLGACSTQEDDFQLNDNRVYFPLSTGQLRIYEMDSTIFDPNGAQLVRQSITQMQEILVDTFTDLSGNFRYIVEQSIRDTIGQPWQIQNVYTTAVIDGQARRVEENLEFIPLVFPFRRNTNWDGTVFIDDQQIIIVAGETIEMYKGWSSRVTSVEGVDTLNNVIYENLAEVSHSDEENLIELRQVSEKYAPDIGLVYRELRILDTQCITEECIGQPWEEKAEKGFILRQTLIESN